MCKIQFRSKQPSRTYEGPVLADYRRYKDFLAKDFNQRCGYTDCPQFWFGGQTNFQIDHFKPISKFPEFKTQYDNLVYACSFVNRAKSNDFGNYLDPCEIDYNEHFYRDKVGNIFPDEGSEFGNYMYKKLKLYLKRFGLIWMLDQLEQRMFALQELIEQHNNPEAKELFVEIGMIYNNYKRYLRAIQ
jgi:hypothetical protein